MRLILEKSEIVAILGKHFDVELDPEKVVIKTEPFEIEVSGLPMTDAPPKEENVVPISAQTSKVRNGKSYHCRTVGGIATSRNLFVSRIHTV